MTKQKRTTVVIAHRLSTIRNADKIAVLDSGKIVEEGPYDELLNIKDGLFAKLARKQEELLAQDKKTMAGQEGPLAGALVEAAVVSDAAKEEEVTSSTKESSKKTKKTKEEKAKEKAEKAEKAKDETAPIMRILGMQKDQTLSLIIMCICPAAGCALSARAFYLMVAIMTLVFQTDTESMMATARNMAIDLVISAFIIIALFTIGGVTNGLSGSALTKKLRVVGIASLMRQEMSFFDKPENSGPELVAFLAEKIDKVRTTTVESMDILCQFLGGVALFMFVLWYYCCWQLLLAWLGMMVLMSSIAPIQMAFMSGDPSAEANAKKEAEKSGKEDTSKVGLAAASANKIVGETVMGVRTVASFNLEQQFFETYAVNVGTISSAEMRNGFVGGFFLGLSMLIMFGAFGGVFYYSYMLVEWRLLDFEGFMAPMFAFTALMPSMMRMGALAEMKNASIAAVRLFRLFDRKPEIDNLDDASGTKLAKVDGAIEVKDVVFAYPSAKDHLVCKGYSLAIPAGATCALCGPSGSGKSTIVSLLERFYDPQQGSVTLDGADLKTLNVRWLRSQFGYVGQEPVLFQTSVSQNIAYGKPGGTASQEEIEEAARMANAYTFITENLSEGFETNVGLKGGKLSGGQKQRVAIARAIIRKPSVLLLDEATSALDNESERVVQAALDEIMAKQKRTTVVIAHRLSTIRNADKIAVVSDGQIVESGTHDELLANQKMYANLVMAA